MLKFKFQFKISSCPTKATSFSFPMFLVSSKLFLNVRHRDAVDFNKEG